jgi:hypothetical protein
MSNYDEESEEEEVDLDLEGGEEEDDGNLGAGLADFIIDSDYDDGEEDDDDDDDEEEEGDADDEEEEEEMPRRKVRRVVRREIVRPAFEEEEEEEEEDDPDEELTRHMVPEEKSKYEILKRVAQSTGRPVDRDFIEFSKKHKDYVEKRVAEDPSFDPSTDEEYQNFCRAGYPKVTSQEIRKAEDDMLVERTTQRVMEQVSPALQKTEHEQRLMQLKPIVEHQKRQATQAVFGLVPEGLANELREKTSEEVRAAMPLEYDLVNHHVTRANQYVSELIEIQEGYKQFDKNNPTHTSLLTWLEREQEAFLNLGTAKTRSADGRQFVTRTEYRKIQEKAPDKINNYYTWSNQDVVRRLIGRSKQQLDAALKAHDENMRAYGKASKIPKVKNKDKKVRTSSPRTPSSRGRGAAPAPKNRGGDNALSDTILSTLGLDE